jgi:imidazolonepropionase-like amidohydrolase
LFHKSGHNYYIDDNAGSLEEGKDADIIVVEIEAKKENYQTEIKKR